MNGCQFSLRHTSSVLSVSFSGDGTRLATGELDGPVRLWSYPNGDLLLTLKGNWQGPPKVTLSSDARLLAVGSYGGSVDLFQADTGELLHQLVRKNEGSGEVAFVSGDDYLLSINNDVIQVWDTRNGELVKALKQDGVNALAVFPDGDIFASVGHFGEIKLWRLVDGKNIAVMQHSRLQDLAFFTDGERLATVGVNLKVAEEDAQEDSPDTKWDTVIDVWNIADASVEQRLTYSDAVLDLLAITPDSVSLATAEDSCYRDRYGNVFGRQCVQIWSLQEAAMEKQLYVPFGGNAMAFSPMDNNLAIGSYENVYIWQVP